MLATAIDVILALVVVEGLGLAALHRVTGKGLAPRALVGNLLAGFMLMLAVRLALGGVGQGPIALCLLGALGAHLLDLATRWPR